MFLAHSFRLRDPWQCEDLADGARRWSRIFHRPTGLEPDDQLVLVISGLPLSAQLTVNGHQLEDPPAPSPLRGWEQPSTGDPKSRERRAVVPRAAMGRGEEVGTRDPSQSDSHSLAQFNLTEILADSNKIDLVLPPAARGLATPATTSFPYDARLAILAQS